MGALIYAAIASLDGYVADAAGGFAWARPAADVHAAVNDMERPIGTYLYGRRMYEVLSAWEDSDDWAGDDPITLDYAAIWRSADKVVWSTTLVAPTTARTRLERSFDPAAVAALKAGSDRDLSIGGPHLAAQALRAGLVDVLALFLVPVVVGGGTRALPDDCRLDLSLAGTRTFADGTVLLRYDAAP